MNIIIGTPMNQGSPTDMAKRIIKIKGIAINNVLIKLKTAITVPPVLATLRILSELDDCGSGIINPGSSILNPIRFSKLFKYFYVRFGG